MSSPLEVVLSLSRSLPLFIIEEYENLLVIINIKLPPNPSQGPSHRFWDLFNAHATQRGSSLDIAVTYLYAILNGLGLPELAKLKVFIKNDVKVDGRVTEALKCIKNDLHKRISDLGEQLGEYRLGIYRLAVSVLTNRNLIPPENPFLEVYDTLLAYCGSYPLAIAFTVGVLERSRWGDTRKLKPFADRSIDFNMVFSQVDLCLTVADYYGNMSQKHFRTAKLYTSSCYLSNHSVSNKSRIEFTLLLMNRGVIKVGNVSKIEDKIRYPNFFEEYEKRCENLPTEMIPQYMVTPVQQVTYSYTATTELSSTVSHPTAATTSLETTGSTGATAPSLAARIVKVNGLVNSISDRVNQFHVEVYRLSLYGVGIRGIEEETSLFDLFNSLNTSEDLPLSVAFTVHVVKRFGFTKVLAELTRYAAPDFNMASSYPETDLLLTVTLFLYDLEQRERSIALCLISSSYMGGYKFPQDKSSYNLPKNVKAMFDKKVIKVGDVSVLDSLAKQYRPSFFNEYKKRAAEARKNPPLHEADSGNDHSLNTLTSLGSVSTTDTALIDFPEESQVDGGASQNEATDLPDIQKEFDYNEKFNEETIYRMNTVPRGYCIIVNMRKGRGEGNEADVNNLSRLFEDTLKFTVRVYNDLTKAQIDILMGNLKKADHTHLCCFIMFILAPGGTNEKDGAGFFETSDGQRLKVSSITHQIAEIDGLNGKPKLLFVQSCRGGKCDQGIEVVDEEYQSKPEIIPTGSDFLTSFATIEDHIACRGPYGSRFIKSLYQVFSAYYTKYDVVTMMTMVTKKVADMSGTVRKGDGSIVHNVKQNPETTFTFRKFLYFGKPDELTYEYIMRQQLK